MLQAQQVWYYLFGLTNGAIAHALDYLLTIFTAKEQTMTNEGAKRNVPHLVQAQQAPVCLWSISETLRCQKLHGLVNCFQEGMLGFDGPLGQCFSKFLTVSQRSRGRGEKEKRRYGIDKKSKSK